MANLIEWKRIITKGAVGETPRHGPDAEGGIRVQFLGTNGKSANVG
jgi:hypothetical protein